MNNVTNKTVLIILFTLITILHILGLHILRFELTLNAAHKLRRSRTAPRTKSITNEVKLKYQLILLTGTQTNMENHASMQQNRLNHRLYK